MTTHRAWLAGQIEAHGWKYGVELGVKSGDLLDEVCRRNPDLYIIGVDTWLSRQGYEDWPHDEHKRQAQAIADCYPGRCWLWEMDTVKAAQFVNDGTQDFVFIDADHSTDAVMADINAWRGKIRYGGMLCGDDASKSSVREALDILVPGWKREGRCWLTPITY